jgi:hypothetical protein
LKTSTDVGKVVGVADVTDKGRAKAYEFLSELDGAVRRGVTGSTRDGMMICEQKIRGVVRWDWEARSIVVVLGLHSPRSRRWAVEVVCCR